MNRLELASRLTNEAGERLVILPWWREAFAALDDEKIRELILWLPRQSGKSQCLAAMAMTELLTRRGSYTVFIAAGEAQAQSIYHRKVRRVLEKVLRGSKLDVIVTRRGIEMKNLGSKLEVLATEESTVPGRSVSLLVVDECRDVGDGVFLALAPSVIGAGGKIVMGSTAGVPRGFFFDAVMNPTPETWLYHSNTNENPFASKPMIEFLSRRLGLLSPTAARRELGNQFVEGGDAFLPAGLIDAAIDDGLGEMPGSEWAAFAFYDLSRKRDLTSRVVVVRGPARRPEAPDHLVVASIRVWDPKKSPDGQVDFAEVRGDLSSLPQRFPRLEQVLVDEGSESGSLLPFGKATAALTLKVRGFVATPESNMALWGALAARLHARTISLPRHERLIAELRGLRQESFSFGSKWRIIDASRKFHRDLSVSLAGATHVAGEATPPAFACTAESLQREGYELSEEPQRGAGFHGRVPASLAARMQQAAEQRSLLSDESGERPRARFWR